MISLLITLLVYLLVLGIIYWLVTLILGAIASSTGKPFPPFINTILIVIFALIALVIVLDIFFNIGAGVRVLNLK